MYISDINTLINLPYPVAAGDYVVGGYFSEGDGGEGTFIWIVPPIGTPFPNNDGGIIFYNTNDTRGHFKRIYSGPINVRWFGAILGQTDPNPPIDPDTGLPYSQPIADVTPYVHAARDADAFANGGTLYFPKGEYPGAFLFDFVSLSRNEINITGDGHGTILRSNGTTDSLGNNRPVLVVGYRNSYWMWARVSYLEIDGQFQTTQHFSDGVQFANPSDGANNLAGRWVFERVFFYRCNNGVLKNYGNIGNHFIDCTWRENEIGVTAQGFQGNAMHSGCDRYSGGHFSHCTIAGLYYYDDIFGGGQIIVDGTIFEQNSEAWAIWIIRSGDARMMNNAI